KLPPGGRLSTQPEPVLPPSLSAIPPRDSSPVRHLEVSRPSLEVPAETTTAAITGAPWAKPWAAPLVPPSTDPAPLGQWTVTTTPEAADPPAVVTPPLPMPRRVAAIAPSV